MDEGGKRLYIKAIKRSPKMFSGRSITQILLWWDPQILEQQEKWIDELLEVELNIKGDKGISCLACLMHSRQLHELNT